MKKRVLLIKYLKDYEVIVSIHNCIVFKKSYNKYNSALNEANKMSKDLNIKFEYVVIKRENKSRC